MAELEALLFVAREPVGSRKLAQLTGLADGTEARTLVRKLNAVYDSGGYSFRVEEIAGGLQLMSRSKFAPWLRRVHAIPAEVRLSAPAMETLAVVAYRQPVLRAQIEAVRGVQCGEILRQLMEKDLVRIVGRSDELGRPFLYGTSKYFLQVFGLRHLDEMPLHEPRTGSRELPSSPTGILSKPEEANPMTLATMSLIAPGLVEEPSTRWAAIPDDDRVTVLAADEDDEEDDDDEEDEELEEDLEDDEDEEEEDEEDLDDDFDDDWEEVEDEDEEEDEEDDWDDDWDDDEDDDDEDDDDEDWDDDEK